MARDSKEHKDGSRARIVAAAGRGFRRHGLGGAGVDGLAREAGVTHGAFHVHFRSMAEAFRAAMVDGLAQIERGVEALQAEHGAGRLTPFVRFYLGHRRTCELGEVCALPTLSAEIERTDLETKAAYRRGLEAVIDAIAMGLPGGTAASRRACAWAVLSLLAGGVTLARAVAEPGLSDEIAAALDGTALAAAAPAREPAADPLPQAAAQTPALTR